MDFLTHHTLTDHHIQNHSDPKPQLNHLYYYLEAPLPFITLLTCACKQHRHWRKTNTKQTYISKSQVYINFSPTQSCFKHESYKKDRRCQQESSTVTRQSLGKSDTLHTRDNMRLLNAAFNVHHDI